jgi:hypothetical protein
MRRTKMAVCPSLDAMEARELLSVATPLVSQRALNGLVREVRLIMSTLSKTKDTAVASAHLTTLSSRIPSGPEELAPAWQSDLGLYRPRAARSIIATQRQILSDLYRYVQGGVDAGNPPVTGSGSTTSNLPGPNTGSSTTALPVVSLDSVTIQNTTDLTLQVTVFLGTPHTPQPFITEIIPAQGSTIALFNFGTATDAFMTMDVGLADGGQTPPPFSNVSLSQPIGGYNGALFTISLSGSYFNVTPL